MLELNSAIKISDENPKLIRLLDRRTGFQIEIDTESNEFNKSGVVNEFKALMSSLGFDNKPHSIEELRLKQLPFRRELQAQERDAVLDKVYNYSISKVPYYRQREAEYRTQSGFNQQTLSNLPILTKQDIRNNFTSLLSESTDIASAIHSKSVRIAQTSGTTSERLQVFSDMCLNRVPPNYKKLWALSNDHEVPKTAVLTTPICNGAECHLGHATMNERTRDDSLLFLNSSRDLFNVSDKQIIEAFNELTEFGTNFILCNPVYLHWYGRRAAALNLPFPKLDLIWSSYQYLSVMQKREIERLFQAPVYNSYTATELSGCSLATECRFGHWHVREDQSLIEIEKITSREDVGNLIVTNHASRLMPLLRYRIGDLGRLCDVDCHCELSNWQVFEYHGRTKDRLFTKTGWISTREFDEVIAGQNEVDFYQARQDTDGVVNLNVIVKLDSQLNNNELVERILQQFSFNSINVMQTNHINPEASLKYSLTAYDGNQATIH